VEAKNWGGASFPAMLRAGYGQSLTRKGERELVNYSEIENAFMFVSMSPQHENSAYLNKETGETYYVSMIGDSDELPEDFEEDENYISIPHKNDLDLGRNLVFDFVEANIPDEFECVRAIFSRKGAYARYKDLLEAKGQLEAWYKFENEATENALRAWCKENGIECSSGVLANELLPKL
jgi:hypothetical protein